jgi:hypothetical protein
MPLTEFPRSRVSVTSSRSWGPGSRRLLRAAATATMIPTPSGWHGRTDAHQRISTHPPARTHASARMRAPARTLWTGHHTVCTCAHVQAPQRSDYLRCTAHCVYVICDRRPRSTRGCMRSKPYTLHAKLPVFCSDCNVCLSRILFRSMDGSCFGPFEHRSNSYCAQTNEDGHVAHVLGMVSRSRIPLWRSWCGLSYCDCHIVLY